MDVLFLLIPLSVTLALLILGALGWAVWRGQFEGEGEGGQGQDGGLGGGVGGTSLEAEGARILRQD